MLLQSVIEKQFADAALQDMVIESSIIEEGFVRKLLDGSLYNRAVHFHKLMQKFYEGSLEWVSGMGEKKA